MILSTEMMTLTHVIMYHIKRDIPMQNNSEFDEKYLNFINYELEFQTHAV